MKQMLMRTILVLLVMGLLSGCGANTGSASSAGKAEANRADDSMAVAGGEIATSVEAGQMVTPANQKLIRTVNISAQTQNMDELLSSVEARIAELGGYVESRNVYNGTSAKKVTRTANLTIRIPAQKLDQFVNKVSEASNVVSHSETTQDVTLTYISTESRIKALETEEARLLELVAEAADLEDLLTLEQRLSNIRTELEEHKSKLRLYDSLVSYSTVHLNVEEVVEYTEVEEEEPEKTAWQRMGEGFVGSIKAIGKITVEIAVFFVSALPFLLPPGLVVVAVLLVNKKKRK